MKRVVGLVMVLGIVCSPAWAQETLVRFEKGLNGYDGLVDGGIRSEAGRQTYNYGASSDISVGWELEDAEFVGFSQWKDIFGSGANQVPLGATIVSAELGLTLRAAQGTEDRIITAYAMTREITDMGSGASNPAAAGEVCWSYLAYDTTMWGGDTTHGPVQDADYTTNHASSLTINVASDNGITVSWDVTDIVNDWYTGALPNYGFLLRDGAWADNETRSNFSSAETSNTGDLPFLKITYEPVPEPATMGLVALGGLALLRRRS